jgi:ABC-type antimicrobial peptide transport system permease subunit
VFGAPLAPGAALAPLAVAGALAVAAGGAVWPIRRALALEPATELKEAA